MSEKKNNKIIDAFKKIKIEYVILIALAVFAMIIFFGVSGNGKTDVTESTSTVDEYVETLENKLKNCLSKVKGAGKVDVIISVGSSMQTVFATQTTTDASGTESRSTLVVSGKPVVLKEAYPEIVGVIVVCEGASNLAVRVDLVNACRTFLSVSDDRIKILSMK